MEGAPSTCGGTYQKLLKDLVTLKEKCELACFKDCCQVCCHYNNYYYATMQNSSSETYRLRSCSLKQVVAFTTLLVPATLMLHSFPQSPTLTVTWTLMEGSGRSSREGSMVRWTSIATGQTTPMGLEIWMGSSGMDWTISIASLHTMMWSYALRLGMGPNPQ